MVTENEIRVWNVTVDMILKRIEIVGEEAKSPEYWKELLAESAAASRVYSTVADELSYYSAMAPTYLETGVDSIVFSGDDEPGVAIDLVTFQKSLVNAE